MEDELMQNWIIPCNPAVYDTEASFEKNGFIDWRQNKNKYQPGDIVCIYCSQTIRKVMFKTIVEKVDIPSSEVTPDKEFWMNLEEYKKAKIGKYFRIRLLQQIDREELSYEYLKNNGLKGSIQSPRRLEGDLKKYIEKYFELESSIYPDSDLPETYYECAVKTIPLNQYERNPTARKKMY